MFCEACGSPLEEDDSFCRRCGRSQSGTRAEDRGRVYRRTAQGRKIAGVCAGCAHYFGKDVTIIRIAWTLSALIPPLFPGIAAYLVSWMLMPTHREVKPEKAPAAPGAAPD